MVAFKDGIIDLVKNDKVLIELDRKIDLLNQSYEMTFDWYGRKYQQIKAKTYSTKADKRALDWLNKKNKLNLDMHARKMLVLTNQLADHMASKNRLPKNFDINKHYIGISTSGGVYVISNATHVQEKTYY